jgi:hypothetical protein
MKKNKNPNQQAPILYHGRKPMNRREFLASGAIPFVAYLTVPSFFSILAKSGVAHAEEICKVSTTKMIPVVTVNLSGGAGLTRNWIPLTEGRELLPKYHKIGLGLSSNLVGQITKAFQNNAPFWSSSGILAGINTSLVPGMASEAMMKAQFVGMCQQSQNDSDANKFDIQGLIAKAGMKGKILPNLGRFDNGIGVSNSSAFLMPPPPLIVGNVDNIANALGVANRLGTLSLNQKSGLFKSITSLSEWQARKLASMTGGDALSSLLGQANIDNTALISNPAGLDLDPIVNTAFSQVWGLNANTAKGSADYINASLVYNAINGNAGSIGIEMGGYDYHGDDLATTNAKDTAAGVVIGKILQSFHAMKSKGFIIVNSDGGVGAPASDIPGADPTADRGDAGAVFMIAYDPTSSTQAVDSQLGHMKSNPEAEAADDTFLVGGSPEIGAAAVFANYLSFNGMADKFSNIAETSRVFDAADLDKILKIHGKAS